jgi:hypothetical protein
VAHKLRVHRRMVRQALASRDAAGNDRQSVGKQRAGTRKSGAGGYATSPQLPHLDHGWLRVAGLQTGGR